MKFEFDVLEYLYEKAGKDEYSYVVDIKLYEVFSFLIAKVFSKDFGISFSSNKDLVIQNQLDISLSVKEYSFKQMQKEVNKIIDSINKTDLEDKNFLTRHGYTLKNFIWFPDSKTHTFKLSHGFYNNNFLLEIFNYVVNKKSSVRFSTSLEGSGEFYIPELDLTFKIYKNGKVQVKGISKEDWEEFEYLYNLANK